MQAGDRLWKAIAQVGAETTMDQVLALTDEVLALPVPFVTQLGGLASILFQMAGSDSGVSVYRIMKPGQELVALASAGRPGPLTVAWGAPVSGLAVQEGAIQFVGSAKALATYFGGWLTVAECIAVPLIRERRGYGSLEVRSASPGHLDLFAAEVVGKVAERIAAKWPDRDPGSDGVSAPVMK